MSQKIIGLLQQQPVVEVLTVVENLIELAAQRFDVSLSVPAAERLIQYPHFRSLLYLSGPPRRGFAKNRAEEISHLLHRLKFHIIAFGNGACPFPRPAANPNHIDYLSEEDLADHSHLGYRVSSLSAARATRWAMGPGMEGAYRHWEDGRC